MRNTTAGIKAEIAKGVFRPHTALTNMHWLITRMPAIISQKLFFQPVR